MRLAFVALALLGLGCAASATTSSGTHMGFTVGLPTTPPPQVVYTTEPEMVVVPGSTTVYYSPSGDYDLFRVGSTWYLYDGSYWFTAPAYSGSYVAVDVRNVPREVLVVPRDSWKRYPSGGK